MNKETKNQESNDQCNINSVRQRVKIGDNVFWEGKYNGVLTGVKHYGKLLKIYKNCPCVVESKDGSLGSVKLEDLNVA